MNSPLLDVSRPPSKATQYIGCFGFLLFFLTACSGVYKILTAHSSSYIKHDNDIGQVLVIFFCAFVTLFACFRGDQSPIGKFIAKVGEIGSLLFFIKLLTMLKNRRNSSDQDIDKTS